MNRDIYGNLKVDFKNLISQMENDESILITSREGAGKSMLAIQMIKEHRKVIFLCESNAQAAEKHESFLKAGLKSQLVRSKSKKLKELGFDVVTIKSSQYFGRKVIDEHATLQLMELKIGSTATKKLWNSIESDEFDLSGSFDIICSTFAQAPQLNGFYKSEWVVMFDDPSHSAVNNIQQGRSIKSIPAEFKPFIHEYLPGTMGTFVQRPERLRLDANIDIQRIYTTTEIIIEMMIKKNLDAKQIALTKEINKLRGNIHLISTEITRKSSDLLIPLFTQHLKNSGHDIELIADGVMGQLMSHQTAKGNNQLMNTSTIIEVSYPSMDKTIPFKVEFPDEDFNFIKAITALDQTHQAVGRNQGYRFKGKSCYVLVDSIFAKFISDNIDYKHEFHTNRQDALKSLSWDQDKIFNELIRFNDQPELILAMRLKQTEIPLAAKLIKQLDLPSEKLVIMLDFMQNKKKELLALKRKKNKVSRPVDPEMIKLIDATCIAIADMLNKGK